jgi:hypothetical protein
MRVLGSPQIKLNKSNVKSRYLFPYLVTQNPEVKDIEPERMETTNVDRSMVILLDKHLTSRSTKCTSLIDHTPVLWGLTTWRDDRRCNPGELTLLLVRE